MTSLKPTLSALDASALIIGLVVGAGIFRAPSSVAENTGSSEMFLLAWVLGGVISLIGALCYAELTTAFPNVGGDYHFLTRAFGRDISFLFAWGRMVIIQSGSIAMLAFVFGDYASQVVPLGPYASSIYAMLAIAVLTSLHLMNVRQGTMAQKVLVTTKLLGLVTVIVIGMTASFPATAAAAPAGDASKPAFGMAMIFVLLTYGGWNEAAYISAELKNVQRDMVRALLGGIGVITAIYLLLNYAFLRGLSHPGLGQSEAVAADLMRRAMGEGGARFISVLVAIAALGSTNGTIFTGARSNFALGRDFSMFGLLGRWHDRSNSPFNALIVQAAIALVLVLFGTWARDGFSTMVGFTAPVFWFFFLLTGLSLFVLRTKEPDIERPFKVPLYPLTPLLFCFTCIYMLNSSLSYTGIGALAGVGALLAGLPLLFFARKSSPSELSPSER